MALPSGYQSNSDKRSVKIWQFLEIEGIPYAFGNFSGSSDLYMYHNSGNKFLGILPVMVKPGKGYQQKVDVMEGKSDVGQMMIELIDDDGQLGGRLGLGVGRDTDVGLLAHKINRSDTTIYFTTGSQYANYSSTSGSIMYCDLETISYASRSATMFTGCSRGRFSSTGSFHQSGSIFTPYPRHLGQRNAYIRYFISESNPSTTEVSSSARSLAADSIFRTVGYVAGVKNNKEGTGYVLDLASIEKRVGSFVGAERKRKIFDNGFKSTLTLGMPGVDNGELYYFEDDAPPPPAMGSTRGSWGDVAYNPDTGEMDDTFLVCEAKHVTRNEFKQATTGGLARYNFDRVPSRDYSFFVQVDEEIMVLEWDRGLRPAPRYSLLVLHRGVFNTKKQKHEKGAKVNEVFPLVASSTDSDSIEATQVVWHLPLPSNNPLDICQSILTSTGISGSNGPHDNLPRDWALGVESQYVDTDEISSTTKLNMGHINVGSIIREPVEPKTFLQKEFFSVLGLFPLMKLNGKYSIRKLMPPLPLSDVTMLGPYELLDNPAWDGNLSTCIGKVTYEYEQWMDGEYRTKVIGQSVDADVLYKGVYGEVNRQSTLLRDGTNDPGTEKVFIFPFGPYGAGRQFVIDQVNWFKTYFERPAPIVNVRTLFKSHKIDAGDLVSLTNNSIIDSRSGSMGLTSGSFVVTNKKINDETGVVDLELLQLGIFSGQFRNIAPSGYIASWDASVNQATLSTNDSLDNAVRGENDISYFTVGDVVVLATADLATISVEVTVTAVDTTNSILTLSGDPTGVVPVAGTIFLFAPYDSCTSEQKRKFAFMADQDRKLGTANDKAHKFVS